ncbi:MAG: universal stress protein [Saprospiraceae bacterium]|nr:universal stress protein [Lewinella sp.]
MKKILLPTDCSELGEYAYEIAHKIARQTEATIDVLSIVPAPAAAIFDTDGNLKSDEGEDYSEIYSEKDNLQDRIEKWATKKEDIDSVAVRIGPIDESIVRHAQYVDADLIVMGTAGAHGIDEILRRSHTAHVVRTSPIPVLCLKCDRSGMLIKNIVLVSDFAKVEELDLTVLKTIQRAFGAKLHLLKVNTPKQFETDRKVKWNMDNFVELNELENVSFHLYSDETVEAGIVNFSTENQIDIVALGTHQRGGIGRMFKHGVSEEVVNHVMQPILTFPV